MTAPNEPNPSGSVTQYGTWGDVQSMTQADWEARQKNQWDGKMGKIGGFGGFLSNVIQGISAGIGGIFGGLSYLISLRWLQVDRTEAKANSIGAQAYYLGENAAANSGKGTWQGIDGTAEVSLPLTALAGNTMPTVTISSGTSRAGTARMDSALPKQSTLFLAYKSGTVTKFVIDVYTMNTSTGAMQRIWTSPDASGNLATAFAWQEIAIEPGIPVSRDDVLVVKFRMEGSGSITLAGTKMPLPIMLPGAFPRGNGMVFSNNTQVDAYTDAQLQPLYTQDTPYFGMGLEGRSNDLPRVFFDDFNRTAFGSLWAVTDVTDAGGPVLMDNRVAFAGTTDGTQGLTYVQPMLTDRVRVGWDVGTAVAATGCGVTLCATSDQMDNALIIAISGNVAIGIGRKASDPNAQLMVNVGGGSDGHYDAEYTPADNTVRVYKNGVLVPGAVWKDTNNLIKHGQGHRFCGVWVSRKGFVNSGLVDNWSAKDVTEGMS